MTGALLDRFREMPRAMQWGIVAALGLVAFLFTDTYVWSMARTWSGEAADLRQRIEKVRSVERSRQLESLEGTITAVGPITLPDANIRDAELGLDRAVSDILARHSLSKDSYDRKRGGKGNLLGGGFRGKTQRIVATLEFETKPDTALQVIADLEADPRVEAVTEVRLTRTSGTRGARNVKVNMTLEAWAIAR